MNNQSEKAIASIGRSITNINKQLELLRNEHPEAMMYVEDGTNYCVMSGKPHDDCMSGSINGAGTGRQDRVLESFFVKHSECGAW